MNAEKKLETVKRTIAMLFSTHEHLRNDDVSLLLTYWRLVDGFDVGEPDRPVTSPATIIRARQKLQSQGYFLPTDPEVRKRRKKREIDIQKWAVEG